MFDIGFPELILVSIISLLVIGPERLPEAIKTLSLWLGRLKRNFSDLKSEIESEIGADDIRQQLHNEKIMKNISEVRDHFTNTLDETNKSLSDVKDFVDKSLNNSLEIEPDGADKVKEANRNPESGSNE